MINRQCPACGKINKADGYCSRDCEMKHLSERTLSEKLGLAIKKARWQKMVKQKDLAKELGVVPSFLSEVESGKKAPSLEMLEELEKRLGPIWSVK
jgi:ribosome-binding protein aMBF1 (putative translation factor)